MDPILPKIARDIIRAQQKDPSLTPADLDAYVRETSGSKYSLQDVQKLIASIDPSINLRNLGRSAVQGLTMNFGDEIAGLFGGDQAKEDMRLRGEMFHDQHPIADGAAGIAGAVLPTLALPEAKAASVGASMLRGAGVGAGIGALSGAGSGEGVSDRLQRGAIGGAAGAAVGAAIPAGIGAFQYMRSPAARASARISHAIDESGGVDAVKATVAAHEAAGRGNETMLMDASPHLRRQADFAANNSDDALVPMAEKIKARQQGMSDRMIGDVQDLSPAGDADADLRGTQLADSRNTWAAGQTGYGGLREANPAVDITAIKSRLAKPVVQQSWRQARLAGDIVANDPVDKAFKAASEGRPVSFDDLHQLKQILDDKINNAFQNGRGSLGNALKVVRDELKGAISDGVPGAADVDAEYAKRMGLENALQAGSKAWDVEDSRIVAREVANMPPAELDEYRLGLASRLLVKLRSAATNRDEAKKIMDAGPALNDKLRVIFGDKDTFEQFMQRVGVEAEMAKSKAVVGGSETARRLQAAGFDPAELGGDVATHVAVGGVHGTIHGLKTLAARAVQGAVTRGTAREAGPILTTQGAPNIQALLDAWKTRDPLLGSLASHVFPAAGAKTATSLFNYH